MRIQHIGHLRKGLELTENVQGSVNVEGFAGLILTFFLCQVQLFVSPYNCICCRPFRASRREYLYCNSLYFSQKACSEQEGLKRFSRNMSLLHAPDSGDVMPAVFGRLLNLPIHQRHRQALTCVLHYYSLCVPWCTY